MMPTTTKHVSKKFYAAQNAKDGLINVNDLSLLTGVAASQLTSFAKNGMLTYYGEYHGKRFFNFKELVNWVCEESGEDAAKVALRKSMTAELKVKDCPYTLKKVRSSADGAHRIEIIWKD